MLIGLSRLTERIFMYQPVYWTNAKARTSTGDSALTTVVLWDWDEKKGKAVADGQQGQVDVYMTSYAECDLTIGVKRSHGVGEQDEKVQARSHL